MDAFVGVRIFVLPLVEGVSDPWLGVASSKGRAKMTKVTTLANMPSSATDVAVKRFDPANLGLESLVKDAKSGLITATYEYKTGDPDAHTFVRVDHGTSLKDGITRNSIRLSTAETVIDDTTDVVYVNNPIEVVVSWNHYGPLYDTAKIMSMIGSAFSLTFDDLATKVPTTGILDAVNHNLLGELYGS